jgi:hypothetical protein
MPFWRRKPLHERLAEEGGLVERPAARPRAPWDTAGIHGVARPREWDAVATIEAPGIDADAREFVVLDDETVIGEDGDELLAEAIDLEPPFRAQAVRRHEDVWAVAANAISVVTLDDDPGGDVVDLARRAGERILVVDGARAFGSIPALERLIEGDGVVHAERLDGLLFEVSVAPL